MEEQLICEVQKELKKFGVSAKTMQLIKYAHYINGLMKKVDHSILQGAAMSIDDVLYSTLDDDACLDGLIQWLKRNKG